MSAEAAELARRLLGVDEEVRPVRGFDGYAVSESGRVFSTLTPGKAIHELSAEMSHTRIRPRSGHLRVRLHRDGAQHRRYIHFLVADAFIGKRPRGYDTCHRDGNRWNNHFANLYYGTRAQNAADRERHRRERERERGREPYRETPSILAGPAPTYQPDPEWGF